MDRVESFFKLRGFIVQYGLKDGNDFYRVISQELYGTNKHPKSARKEICEFEIEKQIHYFQLFLRLNDNNKYPDNKRMTEILEEDIKHRKQNTEQPSERELYACAEKLQIDIFVFSQCDDNPQESRWQWFVFSPILTSDAYISEKFLTFLRFRGENGKILYAEISRNQAETKSVDQSGESSLSYQRPDILAQKHFPHSKCHTFRFDVGNTWDRHDSCINHGRSFSDVGSRDTCKWDREFLENDNSLFRCLSKEVYGTDDYFKLIRKAICDFEEHDDYIDVFSQFINAVDDAIEKERRKNLKEHIKAVCDGIFHPGKGELFAAASLLHAPLFVYTISEKWEMYQPLTSSVEGVSSYITLLESNECRYERLVPRNKDCNCQVVQPRIIGNVKSLQQDLSGVILDIVAKEKPCCPGKRHSRHTHLDHIASEMGMLNQVRPTDERYKYIFPGDTTANVINLLEEEGRTLNQISEGGGSLTDCLCKEIFGDEDQEHCKTVKEKFQNAKQSPNLPATNTVHLTEISLEVLDKPDDASSELDQIDIQLRKASNWIGVPIYVFIEIGAPNSNSKTYKWKRFLPLDIHKTSTCRFYVTLYFNRDEKLFDRVVPVKGCNCQLLPPVSIFHDGLHELSGNETFESLDDAHKPMVEFFLEDLSDDLFAKEERKIPVSHVYTDTYLLMQRPDMHDRVIDQVTLDSHSFYRCLSKEIFGTESYFVLIRKKVCQEMRELSDELQTFLTKEQKLKKQMSRKEKAEELAKWIQKVENDYEADDLEIFVTATCFQTPIYVLSLEVDGNTKWKDYTQLIRKRKPNQMPKRTSLCRSLNRVDKYFVSLIRTSAGHFDRIVPSTQVCNCLIDKPLCTGEELIQYPQMTENEVHTLEYMRGVESCLSKLNIALNNWTMTNQMMQILCEKVVDELEGNRRKVNFATIAGSATGMVGAALAIAGLIAGPVTFGASLGLTIAGGVVGGVGGVTTISSKITEAVLVKKTLAQLTFCRSAFDERSSALKEAVKDLHKRIKDIDDRAAGLIQKSDVEAFDKSILQSAGAILRAAKEFYVIPLAMLRFSIRGATVASAVLGPLTVVLDIGFMAYSIWNLSKGSRTDVSENLRRISSILHASRVQMVTWANGNAK